MIIVFNFQRSLQFEHIVAEDDDAPLLLPSVSSSASYHSSSSSMSNRISARPLSEQIQSSALLKQLVFFSQCGLALIGGHWPKQIIAPKALISS